MPFRRRKQKKSQATHTSVLPQAFPPAVPPEDGTKGPFIPPFLMASVEKAADIAKRELSDTGRITPKALFVYDEQSDPRITVVSLNWRSEFEKDALARRLRDKALQENARAVVVMGIQPLEERHLVTLSGVTFETEVAASVDYVFDGATRTIDRWELRWLKVTPGSISGAHVV